jgi:preprotein translocase subunit SecE
MAKTALVAEDKQKDQKPNQLVENATSTYERARTFLGDVRAEMRKVVTPSRKEVQATTTVVLVTVFVFAAFFFVVDYIFSQGLAAIMGKLVGPQ